MGYLTFTESKIILKLFSNRTNQKTHELVLLLEIVKKYGPPSKRPNDKNPLVKFVQVNRNFTEIKYFFKNIKPKNHENPWISISSIFKKWLKYGQSFSNVCKYKQKRSVRVLNRSTIGVCFFLKINIFISSFHI